MRETKDINKSRYQVGCFDVFPDRNVIRKGDIDISVEPRVMDVLGALAAASLWVCQVIRHEVVFASCGDADKDFEATVATLCSERLMVLADDSEYALSGESLSSACGFRD